MNGLRLNSSIRHGPTTLFVSVRNDTLAKPYYGSHAQDGQGLETAKFFAVQD